MIDGPGNDVRAARQAEPPHDPPNLDTNPAGGSTESSGDLTIRQPLPDEQGDLTLMWRQRQRIAPLVGLLWEQDLHLGPWMYGSRSKVLQEPSRT